MQTNLHNISLACVCVCIHVHLYINITFNDRIWIAELKGTFIHELSHTRRIYINSGSFTFFLVCSSSSIFTWYRVYYIYMNFNSLSCLSNNSYLLSNMNVNDVSVRIVMKKHFFARIYCEKKFISSSYYPRFWCFEFNLIKVWDENWLKGH